MDDGGNRLWDTRTRFSDDPLRVQKPLEAGFLRRHAAIVLW